MRINDLGGWTDTWFARFGRVLAFCVLPGARCRLEAVSTSAPSAGSVTLELRDPGDRYSFDPVGPLPARHPLLEAAVASVELPRDVVLEITIDSGMPPGSGTGTSASVTVAVLGALYRLKGLTVQKDAVWKAAHEVETVRLGWESGVQDQICAAVGGICYIEIVEYPRAAVTRIELPEELLDELRERLVLVTLGGEHGSSELHREVIESLEGGGGGDALEELRNIPLEANIALLQGNLKRLGELMVHNTDCQRSLNPLLVPTCTEKVIEEASRLGALGWKVNGAGGEGSSVTLLMGEDPPAEGRLLGALESLDVDASLQPVDLDSEGLLIK